MNDVNRAISVQIVFQYNVNTANSAPIYANHRDGASLFCAIIVSLPSPFLQTDLLGLTVPGARKSAHGTLSQRFPKKLTNLAREDTNHSIQEGERGSY